MMTTEVREAFRKRLKSESGWVHRNFLVAFAFARGKPYSFAEPRVREGNFPPYVEVAKALESTGIEEHGELVTNAVKLWMETTHGAIIPRGGAPKAEKKPEPQRLYVLVRHDMPPGVILCQAAHAFMEFVFTETDKAIEWRRSNTICVVAVRDETDLLAWEKKMYECRKVSVMFHEPDMGGQATALAVEPSAAKLLRGLPLALSHLNMLHEVARAAE